MTHALPRPGMPATALAPTVTVLWLNIPMKNVGSGTLRIHLNITGGIVVRRTVSIGGVMYRDGGAGYLVRRNGTVGRRAVAVVSAKFYELLIHSRWPRWLRLAVGRPILKLSLVVEQHHPTSDCECHKAKEYGHAQGGQHQHLSRLRCSSGKIIAILLARSLLTNLTGGGFRLRCLLRMELKANSGTCADQHLHPSQ